MSRPIDLVGQKFGRWTVIRKTEQRQSKSIMWECRCDCGTVRVVNGANLRRGLTVSCGCYNSEQAIKHCEAMAKHDMYKDRLYRVWCGMKARCETPSARNYKNYGGRGISVCEEWKEFIPFYEWAIANGYNDKAEYGKCTIDRIDVNGNYEPSNCRWVDMKTQNNNKRKGETHKWQ